MNIFELVKGLYQAYAIKPRGDAPKGTYRPPAKPTLELSIDIAKSRPWKGLVLHHCLPGDTLITMSNGSPMGINNIKKGDTVCCLDGRDNQRTGKVLNVWCNGEQETYEIKTATRTIRATGNHPFLSLTKLGSGNIQKLEWKIADEMKKGDAVVILKRFNREDIERDDLSDNLLQLIGLFIGDGSMWLTGRGYAFMKKGGGITWHAIAESKKCYADIAIKEFGEELVKQDKRGFSVYRKKYAELFDDLGLYKKCKEKALPNWIFDLSVRQKLLVLRGIVDSDGSVSKRGVIAIRMNNKALIEQIKALCLSCGIRVSNTYYSKRLTTFRGYTYYSENWGFHCQNTEDNGAIGSNRNDFQERLVSHNNRICDYKNEKCNREICKRLDNNGLALDKIVSIKKVSRELVYDIEVEGFHNFIANGIVVHNSETTKDTTESIRRFHTSFRIDHDTVAAPVVNKAPGKQYVMGKNGLWYQTDQYNRYFEEKKTLAGRVFEDAWIDIAYNGVIEHTKDEVSFHWGRSLAITGAHAGYKEYNETFLGLCVIGNYDLAEPSPSVWDFTLKAVRSFMDVFGFTSADVIGHREVYDREGVARKKECPGSKWNLDLFREEL